MNFSSLNRLAKEEVFALYTEYKDEFNKLNLDVIVHFTIDIFEEITIYLHKNNHLILWIESLKEILSYYSKSVLENAKTLYKEVDDLIRKIKKDKTTIINSYKDYIAKAKIDEITVFFDHLNEFLEVSSDMISFSCSKIREKLGPVFTLKFAKSFIDMRSDLDSNEKADAVNSCKDIIDNFKEMDNENVKEICDILGSNNLVSKKFIII